MIIGVDLDDVLGETTVALNDYHNDNYGTSLTFDDHYTFDLPKLWNVSEKEFLRRIKRFNASKYFDNIKPIMEAQSVLKELSKKHTIKIITARMEEFKEKTEKWLEKHYPEHKTNLHHANHYYGMNEHTKSHICKEMNVDVLIDDCLDYALECGEAGILVLLLDKPWNQINELPKNVIRVKNWGQVLKKIGSLS